MGKKTNSQTQLQNQQKPALFTCYGNVDGKCQKLLQQRTRLMWGILLAIDVVSIIAYLIVALSTEMKIDLIIVICFGVILLASIFMFVILYDQIKKANQLGIVNQYDFYEKTIKAKSVKNGEVKGTANHFYSEFILVKKVDDYVFLSPTKSSFYPINVKDMSQEEYKKFISFIDKMKNAKRKNI